MIWLVGLLASGLAMLARLAGLFAGWDARLLKGPGEFPLWVELVCAVLFAFGTAMVASQVTAPKFRAGLIAAILLQPASAMAVGALAGVRVSPFTWLVAILTALGGVAAYRFSSAGKRAGLVRDVFGKHLSTEALARLLGQSDAMESRATKATILSARYLGADWAVVEDVAHRLREQSAWVEVQTGNRLLAVWNLPLTVDSPAAGAVEASLDLGDDWQRGVATGEVRGELTSGAEQWQMRGLAFEKSDALCQANNTFGSRVLLDLATADLVRDSIILRPVDFLVLPASEMATEVFEPLAMATEATPEAVARRDRFWEAVIFFRQKRFAEALAAFDKSGKDPVVQYYQKRLEKLTSSH